MDYEPMCMFQTCVNYQSFHGVVVSGLEVVVSGLVVVEPGLEVVEPGLGLLEVSDNNMMMIIVFSYCILHQKSMRQQFWCPL